MKTKMETETPESTIQMQQVYNIKNPIFCISAGFVGGISAIGASILSIVLSVIHSQPAKMLLYIHILFFGIIACILETPPPHQCDTSSCSYCKRTRTCTFGDFRFGITIMIEDMKMKMDAMRQQIMEAMPLLKYLWGRGAFYVFFGTIQITLPSLINLVVGLYVIVVGSAHIIIGVRMRNEEDRRRRRPSSVGGIMDGKSSRQHFGVFHTNKHWVLGEDEFCGFGTRLNCSDIDEEDLGGEIRVKGYSSKWLCYDGRLVEVIVGRGFNGQGQGQETQNNGRV